MAILVNTAKRGGIVWKKYGNWAKINLALSTGNVYYDVYHFGASLVR